MIPEVLFVAYAFVVGACIGSFLNVCVHRWPRGQSVVRPRSACPTCRRQIRWYENVPLLSWIALRARCGGCGSRISAVYPMVELAVALIWAGAVLQLGVTLTALRMAVFLTLLLGIMLTDLTEYEIPDGFTVTGLLWGLGTALVALALGHATLFAELPAALLGACVGAGAIAIVGWLGEVLLRKEAMGFGDVTLMAMIGAHLGPGRTLLTVLVGAALGAVLSVLLVVPIAYRRRGRGEQLELNPRWAPVELPPIPFGVFLAPAAFVALVWGERLLDWYIGLLPVG